MNEGVVAIGTIGGNRQGRAIRPSIDCRPSAAGRGQRFCRGVGGGRCGLSRTAARKLECAERNARLRRRTPRAKWWPNFNRYKTSHVFVIPVDPDCRIPLKIGGYSDRPKLDALSGVLNANFGIRHDHGRPPTRPRIDGRRTGNNLRPDMAKEGKRSVRAY